MHKFTVKSKLKYGKFYLAEKGGASKSANLRVLGRKSVAAMQNGSYASFYRYP